MYTYFILFIFTRQHIVFGILLRCLYTIDLQIYVYILYIYKLFVDRLYYLKHVQSFVYILYILYIIYLNLYTLVNNWYSTIFLLPQCQFNSTLLQLCILHHYIHFFLYLLLSISTFNCCILLEFLIFHYRMRHRICRCLACLFYILQMLAYPLINSLSIAFFYINKFYSIFSTFWIYLHKT